jgi:SAM-dependent methyltransferase
MGEATALHVDGTNADQARAWDGGEGAYWAANAERFDRAVAAYHRPLMAAAGIRVTDRVLDIGCGTGQTTRDAALAANRGSALGVDLSARMIELAGRLAADAGVANAGFEQADAQIHPFPPGAFDVAISRTGTMFFGDPVAAFTNIAHAVRRGGRLVMLVWQDPEHNEWIRELSGALAAGRDLPAPPVGAPGPFAQADREQVREVLERCGFSGIRFTGLEEPMCFGASPDEAFSFVLGLLGWLLDGLDDAGRDRAFNELRTTIAAHATATGVFYKSATWLVEATRA